MTSLAGTGRGEGAAGQDRGDGMSSQTAQKATSIEVQSYGGGVQSVALAILNATDRIEPPARLAIMADPGSEEAGTYTHFQIMQPWLADRGIELVPVGQPRANGSTLYDYVMERSTVIPVRLALGGLGRRQCTKNWKVDAIHAELKRRGHKEATIQLGISWDEIHRMKDSAIARRTHRFPLVEQRVTREDCRRIITAAGLPEPPKSRCQFCPLQTQASWRWRAASEPESFEQAARLEDAIIERERSKGRGPAYLSSTNRPLREAFATGQAVMFTPDEDEACGGYCFT